MIEDVLEDEYPIAEQENNQQPYEDPKRSSNKRCPQVVINQYPKNKRLLLKDKENVQWIVPGNSSYSEIVRYGRKSFTIGTSMVKGFNVKT